MSVSRPDPADADRLAAESLREGDAFGWFEKLYAEAGRGRTRIPWDRDAPNPLLIEWLANHPVESAGKKAVVVGCGLGNDAELIAERGFDTTAFDIAPSALQQATTRYPHSSVHYRQADLFDLPADWHRSYDLVVESITVQSLPPRLHEPAAAAIASLVRVGGLLVVIAAARTDPDDLSGPPFALTGDELGYFAVDGVERAVVETVPIGAGRIRWRAEYRRPDPEHDEDKSHVHWL